MSRPLFLVVCVVLSGVVFGIFIRQPRVNRLQAAKFLKTVQGTAPKPYVQRVLVPVTVRLITAATPAGARTTINEWLQQRRSIQQILRIRRWDPEHAFEYAVGMALMYLSLVGFAYALRYFLTGVFRAPRLFADGACLAALLGLPPSFEYYGQLYDFPNLLLVALTLGLMVRRRWRLYLLVFAAATLNKETTILLIMLFVIYFWNKQRMDRRSFTRLVLLQVGIFASLQLALMWAFRNNPGSPLLLGYYRQATYHLFELSSTLLHSYTFASLFTFFAAALALIYKWSEKPTFLKHGLWIAVPLFCACLCFGYLDEWRDYYEVYPVIVLLLSHTTACILGIEVTNIERKLYPAQEPPELLRTSA